MNTSLALLDTALRAAALALLAVLGLLALRGRVRQPLGRVTAALAGGLGLQLLAAAPAFAQRVPLAVQGMLAAVSVANAVVFWLFARALVDARFALRRTDGLAWAAVASASLLHCLLALRGGGMPAAAAGLALGLLPLAFGGLALRALLARRASLDGGARGLGALVIGGGFAYALGQQLLRLGAHGARLDGSAAAIDAAALLALLAVVAWQALRLDSAGPWGVAWAASGVPAAGSTAGVVPGRPAFATARLGALAPTCTPAPAPAPARGRGHAHDIGSDTATAATAAAAEFASPPSVAATPGVLSDIPPAPDIPPGVTHDTPPDPADDRLLAALEHLMATQHAYRDEDLGIAALAERLAAPEYRLRRVINRRLGHRNFNAYLNGLRLAEARVALADPERRALPVLTIALSAGFQSIGPFNRAFKADTGLTPTQFRRQKLADS